MKPYYILDDNHAVVVAESFDAWMSWIRKYHDRMETALTAFPECHVRTVFLGVESNGAPPSDPPATFETVIIGGPHDARTVTATNIAQALQNHRKVSELVAKEALQSTPNFAE